MDTDNWDTLIEQAADPTFHGTDKAPWCRYAAWVYLLALAAHDKRTIHRGGHNYTLQRGQALITLSQFAFICGWSRAAVQRFFAILRMRCNVSVVSDVSCSIVSIPLLQKNENRSLAVTPDTLSDTRRSTPALTVETHADTLSDTPPRKKVIPISGDSLFSESTTDKEKDGREEDASHLRMRRQQSDFRLGLSYLNAKIGSKFSVSPDLEKRIAGGATLEQIKTVVDKKFDEWNGTEQAVFLRPSTLFCKKHFNEYLGQAPVKIPAHSRHVSASWPASAYGTPTATELEDLKRIQELDEATERAAGNI